MHHLQHIAELAPVLEAVGVEDVVIAPGSRNAPLIHLFTRKDSFRCHSIVDERSAGYVALGMARQSGHPVVVLCTSGTAVLNLSPAVAEAFHQRIPLIVLSADRPREKLPQLDNQVLDQRAPFFNFSKAFFEIPAQVRSGEELQKDLRSVFALLKGSLEDPRGPVHLNLPLVEPLYVPLPVPMLTPAALDDSVGGQANDFPLPELKGPGTKILILAGMGSYPASLPGVLEELSDSGQVTVVAENISNLSSEQFVSHPELVLAGARTEELQELEPDVVIAFGQQLVSKRMKLFVSSLEQASLLALPGSMDPAEWLKKLADSLEKQEENAYNVHWLALQERESASAAAYFRDAPFSNLAAVQKVLALVPDNAVIHLGNSGTIRYSQLVPGRAGHRYYSNRGVSGIDGSLSAALGAAMVSGALHVLVLGDLSFVYDSNALWNKDFPDNLKIVVLNDGGGGIFRLLEGPDQMDFFEEFSVTHHPVSLELLAQSFGREFQRVDAAESLEAQLEVLFASGSRLSVLEVDTTAAENSRIFKQFFSRKTP